MYSANLPVCACATLIARHAHAAAVSRERNARGRRRAWRHAGRRLATLRCATHAHRAHPQNAVRRHGDAAACVRLLVPVVQVGDRLHAQLRRMASGRRTGAGWCAGHGTAVARGAVRGAYLDLAGQQHRPPAFAHGELPKQLHALRPPQSGRLAWALGLWLGGQSNLCRPGPPQLLSEQVRASQCHEQVHRNATN